MNLIDRLLNRFTADKSEMEADRRRAMAMGDAYYKKVDEHIARGDYDGAMRHLQVAKDLWETGRALRNQGEA